MNRYLYCIAALLIVTISLPLSAAWYQAEGKGQILNGDVDAARKAAVEDALRNALFQSGATISGVSELSQGVLQSDRFALRANGEVQNIQLMKEQRKGDEFIVTLRADIQSRQTCSHDNYLKSLLIGPVSLKKRQQAQLGSIYRVGKEIALNLYKRIEQTSSNIDARAILDTDIYIPERAGTNKMDTVMEIAALLAEKYNVQYISFGEIKDISDFDANLPGVLDFGQTDKRRNFTLDLYLIDGVKGEIVLQKSYSGHESWELDNTQKVDVSGQVFWRSKYGQLVSSTIEEMAADIDTALFCLETAGQITHVSADAVIINLGSSNGVKTGDSFHLVRTQNQYIGVEYKQMLTFEKGGNFTVTAVQADRATLVPQHVSGLGNVQLRDLLLPNPPQ